MRIRPLEESVEDPEFARGTIIPILSRMATEKAVQTPNLLGVLPVVRTDTRPAQIGWAVKGFMGIDPTTPQFIGPVAGSELDVRIESDTIGGLGMADRLVVAAPTDVDFLDRTRTVSRTVTIEHIPPKAKLGIATMALSSFTAAEINASRTS